MASEPKKFMVSWPKIYATLTLKQYPIHPPPAGLEKVSFFLVAKFFISPQREQQKQSIFIYSFEEAYSRNIAIWFIA